MQITPFATLAALAASIAANSLSNNPSGDPVNAITFEHRSVPAETGCVVDLGKGPSRTALNPSSAADKRRMFRQGARFGEEAMQDSFPRGVHFGELDEAEKIAPELGEIGELKSEEYRGHHGHRHRHHKGTLPRVERQLKYKHYLLEPTPTEEVPAASPAPKALPPSKFDDDAQSGLVVNAVFADSVAAPPAPASDSAAGSSSAAPAAVPSPTSPPAPTPSAFALTSRSFEDSDHVDLEDRLARPNTRSTPTPTPTKGQNNTDG
ncbi:hypothetical protein DACRYDRAFT_110385 [Dacryopinax primogenitus]|uniref:Uncharacterized protein n=1 Tax=Dacryopinax primogenitus (strain DJM 731) TaxID=1858805 RepID=M5FUA8_DACPD|nr:uncharacterized protein DACRYDRAFT_110385 [Dacryopinax primogenitus]EJT99064.1 hypothetical protein DACRYDRAFT_110385 [Dacryopinax primogenitus]